MVVGALGSRTEVAIVGAGPGGYVAALRAADAGLDVTLVDRADLGGTCLNVGCIPSKALIEIANLRHGALTAGALGLSATVDVNTADVNTHLRTVTAQLKTGVTSLLRDAGVTVVVGDASVVRYDRLSIRTEDEASHLEFDNLIIATGSRPVTLANFPLDKRIMTSTGAFALDSVPQSMVIVGGGYIGIELGTAWAKLGASVTIIEAASTILPATPDALRQPVVDRLAELGVQTRLGVTADHPTNHGIVLDTGEELPADIIIVAVGRRPNSDQASLDVLPLTISPSKHIVVDSQMRAARGVYAIGDVVAGPALAHKATAEAEVAVDALLGRPTQFAPAAIPEVIFSDPEIMTVGVGLHEAKQRGLEVHRFPHVASARSRTLGSTAGATFLVLDVNGTVVGIHAAGPHVSELAGEAALAIEMAATVQDLALTIHPHPTMSESIVEAAWIALRHPLHIRR